MRSPRADGRLHHRAPRTHRDQGKGQNEYLLAAGEKGLRQGATASTTYRVSNFLASLFLCAKV